MWDVISEALGEPSISEKSKKILRDQKIDENQPGTILRDFTTLLEFIGDDGLKTTGKYYMLPQGKLNELNERMSRPVKHRLKRPQQRSFPHLHGLFMILRASGMGIGKERPRLSSNVGKVCATARHPAQIVNVPTDMARPRIRVGRSPR